MFNYTLLVEDGEGDEIARYQLDAGTSRKRTFTTLSGKPANKVLPFGKLYVNEGELPKSAKATKVAKTS